MVGLTDKQIEKLPKKIIEIKRTEDIEELVKLYSMSDVFFNPSIQETFSMVTLEALTCGTPCVVMNSTSTPELIQNEKCGIIEDDLYIEKIYKDIKQAMKYKNSNKSIEVAKQYDVNGIGKYIDLYKRQ